KTLDGNRDRHDQLPLVVDPDDVTGGAAGQRLIDLGIALAVGTAELAIARQLRLQPAVHLTPGAIDEGRSPTGRRRQVVPEDLALRIEVERIDDQRAVAVVDA